VGAFWFRVDSRKKPSPVQQCTALSGYSPGVAADDELNWDDLRYFLHAAQAKTLARAARSLGVEHTTIGRRLSALERSLGAALVLRGPGGLELTRLGERALPLVMEVERAILALKSEIQSGTWRVRLAVPSGLARLFTEALPRLKEAQPQIGLELVSGARTVDLKKGEADVALRSGPVDDAELVVRKLVSFGWSLYASETYLARHATPIDTANLRGHSLIGFDESLSGTPAAKWLEERARTGAIVLRSREMTDMLGAALSGTGIALLPCALADETPALRRLTPDVIVSRGVSLVYCREAKLSEAVRIVVDYVVDVLDKNADRVSGVIRSS
jgi:DNA-binding transcriptional LysR family regulator